jgi:hypothetical protein
MVIHFVLKVALYVLTAAVNRRLEELLHDYSHE